jgi:predicted phage terminase large subunit-like protein
MALTAEDWDGDSEEFERAMRSMSPEDFEDYLASLPEGYLNALVRSTTALETNIPASVLEQAMALDPKFVSRPHLEYLSARITAAYEDVKAGTNRMIMVSMPPRTGKSALLSEHLPVWLLRQQPTWKFALVSYTPTLAIEWSRAVRKVIAERGLELGVQIARDAGAVTDWETTEGGEVHARSVAQGLTGFGANVLIIDDPVKNSIVAHNFNYREMIWSQWTANMQTRLEAPFLVVVVQTRWHEDDLSGRLQNPEIVGANPEEWEKISFPAIAEEDDVLGRKPGDPLFSPLIEMTRDKALAWWERLKRSMSSYDFAAQFQQRPAPAQGAIFNVDWWRFWTTRPEFVSYKMDENGNETSTPDGTVILRPDLSGARLLDSWDLNFDDTVNSDFVVAQRWGMTGARRYLLSQVRGRWDFPETLKQFELFNDDRRVHEHLVEKKANGAAMIKMLSDKFSGIKPINPTSSKEVRARAITAEVESGHVYLPDPREFPWVNDLLDELREFPSPAAEEPGIRGCSPPELQPDPADPSWGWCASHR